MGEAAEREAAGGSAEHGLRRLVAGLPDGFALLRGDRLLWANQRLVDLCGLGSLPELLSMPVGELFEDTGRGAPGLQAPAQLECGLRRPYGERKAVVCERLEWDSPPEQEAWLIQDVTALRVLEGELLRTSKELGQAYRELSALREQLRNERAEREQLLAVVSHELRTPITVIRGYSRLLLSGDVGPLEAEQRRLLEESAKSCKRLNDFIGDLLEASRDGPGGEILEIGREPLEPLIASVFELLRPLADERAIEVRIDVPPDASCARCDRLRVERILANLVGNAIKHARRGGSIEIATRALSGETDGSGRPFVEISVSDDGPGVAPEDRERIFQPYVRCANATGTGGLGLGLAICKRLVEAHGGRIGVSEGRGGGSCFAFTLPVPQTALRTALEAGP
jgi:signal transduction histidine kinase